MIVLHFEAPLWARRPQAAVRETMPHGPGWCMADWSQRAALWDGPYAGSGRGMSFVVVRRSFIVMPPLIGEVA